MSSLHLSSHAAVPSGTSSTYVHGLCHYSVLRRENTPAMGGVRGTPLGRRPRLRTRRAPRPSPPAGAGPHLGGAALCLAHEDTPTHPYTRPVPRSKTT